MLGEGRGAGGNINLQEGDAIARMLVLRLSSQKADPSQHHVRYYNSDVNLQFHWHEEPGG